MQINLPYPIINPVSYKHLDVYKRQGLDDKENEAAKQKVLEALKSGMNAATFQQLEKAFFLRPNSAAIS